MFAPYSDTTLWPPIDLASASAESGIGNFTLAFIQSDGTCKAAWGGFVTNGVDSDYMVSEIQALRASGGDVIIGFGGANGVPLADACGDVSSLGAAYESVLDRYDVDRIDFDIEGAAIASPEAVARRFETVASLQADRAAAGKPLNVSLTLPVLPSGLTLAVGRPNEQRNW